MRLPLLVISVIGLAAAAPAFAQTSDPTRDPVDPRSKFDPGPPSDPNPNRINPRFGTKVNPGNSDVDTGNPAAVASVQPVPGGADTLEPMGDMQIYTPPSLASGSSQPASLPGMDLYTPPSADSGSGAATGYPAWWPQ